MAEKLLQEFYRKLGAVKLVPGRRSSFEVSLDGERLFSKLEQGRFPEVKEIREMLRAA